jgi:hypothetical protein
MICESKPSDIPSLASVHLHYPNTLLLMRRQVVARAEPPISLHHNVSVNRRAIKPLLPRSPQTIIVKRHPALVDGRVRAIAAPEPGRVFPLAGPGADWGVEVVVVDDRPAHPAGALFSEEHEAATSDSKMEKEGEEDGYGVEELHGSCGVSLVSLRGWWS